MLCRATKNAGCVAHQIITEHTAAGSFNFPKMERSGDTIYLAWTQPIDSEASFSTIRMVALDLSD
jgi:hypothetical protein